MKNITTILTSVIIISVFAACGSKNTLETKRAELEKLKSQQSELITKITTLEDEIVALGDSIPKDDPRAKVIATTPITKQTFTSAIDVQGKVDGDENITYSSKVPSVVTKILVKVGQKVKPGQVLAELDTRVMRAQLDALKKQYELVNTVFEKRKDLWDQKVGSEIEYLQAKNQKEGLEKQIDATKEGLDMYYIKSDFNGTVDVVNIKVGQNVAPGIQCITVVNPSKLKIRAEISEAYAGMVNSGDVVNLYFPDIQKSIKTAVTYSSKSIDAMTRTFKVEILLPNDVALNPNMVAEVKIISYQKPNSIVIPINTIQQIDGISSVFISSKNGNKIVAKKVQVEIGREYNGKAEILKGLSEGDELITTGFQDLTDGQSLKL